jgi:N-dimethylarginine dimethylaminohydrolase
MGFLPWETQPQTPFEGEGDALFSSDGKSLWAAHGVRTCRSSHRHVADAWHVPVTSLQLVDPRFYHLDTCFAPLADGYLMYFPAAFHPDSLAKIEAAYPADKRIAVDEADATRFACNAICVGRTVILNRISDRLAGQLTERGFEVRQVDLGEFLKSGGAAKALALRLSDMAVTHNSYQPAQTPAIV